MDKNSPFKVLVPGGKIPLVIMDAKDGLPAAFALMGTRAQEKVAIRLSGGCKGMNAEDKEQMISFFETAFRGFKGVIWSGATRQLDKEGQVDPMVTDVPGVIAAANPGCIALGTLPRVDLLSLQGNSRLVLDSDGTIPNPAQHGILIVQNGADGKLGWDGDVDIYLRIMENWRDYADFSHLGVIAWNGGAITQEEIEKSAARKWLTVLIEGSGRVADEIINKIKNDYEGLSEYFKGDHVVVISKDWPEDLRSLLVGKGFFPGEISQ